MKTTLICLATCIALLRSGPATAEEKKAADSADSAQGISAPAATEKPKLMAEDLEAKFKVTMTKATMSGRWCPIKDGVLGAEKEDKYTIVSVTRLSGDSWINNARIQYNNCVITNEKDAPPSDPK